MNSSMNSEIFTRSISSKLTPQTIGEVIDYADWMWTHFGTYTEALKNAVRYFLGEITISPVDNESPLGPNERKAVMDELTDTYKIFSLLGRIGDEYIQWGNSFTSVELPRIRRFTCPACKLMFPANTAEDISYSGGKFSCKCTKCNYSGVVDFNDATDENAAIRVIFWNPRAISISYSPTTKSKRYYISPPESWKKALFEQQHDFLVETPIDILNAIEEGATLEIKNEYFKHLATPSPSTMEDVLSGWGLPLFMSEFETVIQLQMMKRYNEAILSDFVVPWRVLSPPATGGGAVSGDPLGTLNMNDFRSQMMRMVNQHRMNPTDVQVAPFPVTYQIFGGEASKLIPLDIEDSIISRLLNSMCIPLEFKTMTMSQGGGPPAGLRRFEKVWANHVSALDEWLQWFCDRRTDLLRKQAVTARLVKSSIYEDDISREYKVKLAMGQSISMDTGMRPLGIDYNVELHKMQDERNQQMEMEKQNQMAMAAADELSAGMSAPPAGSAQLMQFQQAKAMQEQRGMPMEGGAGGMPPGAPPSGGVPPSGGEADIEALWAQAEQLAEQIRTAPSDQRKSQLINLKKTNPAMHAFVKQIIETTEQQAAQQGVAASRNPQ
jgi:hypothetical protein